MVLLERLVNVLGAYGMTPLGARPDSAAVIRGVALYDPSEEGPGEGDAFLAVGVTDPERAVRLAIAARAQAAVVRGVPEGAAADEADASARAHGVALLSVDASVPWGQICGIVYGLVLEGGETESGRGPADLPALADAVAARVGDPVTIEDRRFRVLAHSDRQQPADRARLATILGRRVPDTLLRHFDATGVTAHLASSAEPVYVPAAPEHGLRGRTAVAVRVGREVLGSLWAASDRPLGRERTALLAEGARTVALHLLRTRVSADLERQVESDLVNRVLEGGSDPTEAAGRLGLSDPAFRVVALQAHTPGERHAAVLMAFERATTGFGWSRPGRSTVFGSTVYTVLPCGADPAPARDWVRETTRGLPEHVVVHAGIGAPAGLDRLPDARREADESLTLHAARPAGAPPVAYDESWDDILLHRLRMASASGRRPADGPVAHLGMHDRDHGTRYVATLRAWLHAQGDASAAAALLEVHPNTVRYRMRRMGEHTRLELDDARSRLALSIALEVYAGED